MTPELTQLETAARRADPDAFRAVANRLARQRHPDAVEALLQALQHHDAGIRAAAADAAGHLDHLSAVDPLFLLLQDPEPSVRDRALAALIRLGPGLLEREPARPALRDLIRLLSGENSLDEDPPHEWTDASTVAVKLCIALLHHGESAIRVCAAELLGATRDRRAVDELLLALTHVDEPTRVAAAVALGEHGKTSRIIAPLVEAFYDHSSRVRTAVALALSRFDALGSVPPERMRAVVEHLLRFPDVEARRRVVLMLGRSRGTEAVDLLLTALNDREASVRAEAIVALSRCRDPRIESALRVALTDPEEVVRLRAVDAMERLGTPEPLPLALKDPSPLVRVQAIKALRWTGVEPVLPELLASLCDPAEAVRLEVVELLAGYLTPEVVRAFADALPRETFPLIRQKLLAALGKDPEEHDALIADRGPTVDGFFRQALTDPASEVRAQAVQFLGESAVGELLPLADDEAPEVRLALVRAIERCDRAETRAVLDRLLGDASSEVREAAVWSLRLREVGPILAHVGPMLGDPSEAVRTGAASLLALLHFRDELPLDQLALVFARTALAGRLAILEMAEGIRDRRIVPLLLIAIRGETATERERGLRVLFELKRGDPPRRPLRLAEEIQRRLTSNPITSRPALRPPEAAPDEALEFHVSAGTLEPGHDALIRLWAVRPGSVDLIPLIARPMDESDTRIRRRIGSGLSAVLTAPGLVPIDPEDDLPSDMVPTAARFLVRVPGDAPPGWLPLRVLVLRDGLPVAEIAASVEIGPSSPPTIVPSSRHELSPIESPFIWSLIRQPRR